MKDYETEVDVVEVSEVGGSDPDGEEDDEQENDDDEEEEEGTLIVFMSTIPTYNMYLDDEGRSCLSRYLNIVHYSSY